jgi:hypothetical protein
MRHHFFNVLSRSYPNLFEKVINQSLYVMHVSLTNLLEILMLVLVIGVLMLLT